jgi:deoxyribonuclease-4
MNYLGYHTSVTNKKFKKSLEDAIRTSGINAFQVFVRNPMSLKEVDISTEIGDLCKNYVIENNLFLVSHASYLFNFANMDKYNEKVASAINELLSSEKIGAIGSVFHVGKHLKLTIDEGTNNMFSYIKEIINNLQVIGSKSIFILETPAGCGTELLYNIEKLGEFYRRFSDIDRENLKICIDTCHIYSSGYSLETMEESQAFIDIVEISIGWKNVVVIHLNDSKKGCGCRVDRHENFCVGCITKDNQEGMKHFVKHCFSLNIPMILETPEENYENDLKVIKEWIRD